MRRRELLAGLGGVALAGMAGCLDAVGMAEHEATPAGVDASTRSNTGYEQTSVEPLAVTEDVVLSEQVTVINYLTEHEKAVDMGPLGSQRGAVFIVLTTPHVSILGREFNPIEEMSTQELVDMVEDNYDDIGNITHDADGEVTILDQETTQSRFEADAQFDGRDAPVYLHITESVSTETDHLVTISVYPRDLRATEEENVFELMENVVSSVDEEPTNGSDDSDADDGGDDDVDGDADDGDDDVDRSDEDGDADEDEEEDDEEDDDGLLGL